MKLSGKDECLLGILSDTHGLLRPEVPELLSGADLILHAGDIGAPEVLTALRQVAPVVAVRGNVDVGEWARELPETAVVEVGPHSLYMLHDLGRLDLDPAAAGLQAVISGHSHQPAEFRRDDVLYLNPGSAGHRRFQLPVSLALLRVRGSLLESRIFRIKT